MTPSQYEFEIARDLVTLMKSMKPGEDLTIQIHANKLTFDWTNINGNEPCGPSEASLAMRKAYDGVYHPNKTHHHPAVFEQK